MNLWLEHAEKFTKSWAKTIAEFTGAKFSIQKESTGNDVVARVRFMMKDGSTRLVSFLLNEENYWGIRGMALDFASFFSIYCVEEPFYLYSYYMFEKNILSFRLVKRNCVCFCEISTKMPETWEEANKKWTLWVTQHDNETKIEVEGNMLFKTIAYIMLLVYLARKGDEDE